MRTQYLKTLTLALVTIALVGPHWRAHAAAGPASIITPPADRTVLQGNPTTFTVIADGSVHLTYQWSKDSVAIAGATGASYSIAAVQPGDEAAYSVLVSNSLGSASRSAFLTVDPGLVTTQPSTLIPIASHVWKYNQSGSELGTAWKEVGFNDSTWASGIALFGLESTPLVYPEPFRTALALGSPQVITYYFRTHFNFTGSPGDVSLVSSNLLDDGVVYYLNGSEVSRLRVATGQTSSTLADGQSSEGAYEILNFPTAALLAGDNVLAAEVHQTTATSTDVAFGLSLLAITSVRNPDNQPPFLTGAASVSSNRVLLSFSERVELATATNISNYSISDGIGIAAVAFTNDSQTIVLYTSTLTNGASYTVTVSNVRDRAVNPNLIAANSQQTFTVGGSSYAAQDFG